MPTRWKLWKAIVAAFGVFCLLWWVCSGHAHADPGTDDGKGPVQVATDVTDGARLQARITAQLRGDDGIWVIVAGPTDPYAQKYFNEYALNDVLIVAIGPDVYVRGNNWVPQVYLDDSLARIKNVSQGLGDRIVGLIVAIHQYQESHQPPPPPPPPPGPPPPPPGPSVWDFHWWNWAWGWAPITFGVLFVIWLPLELRRRRRYAAYMKRADEQADWSYDQYGIKSTVD